MSWFRKYFCLVTPLETPWCFYMCIFVKRKKCANISYSIHHPFRSSLYELAASVFLMASICSKTALLLVPPLAERISTDFW